MALKFRHINTQQTLNTVKFSADSTNATYFLHSSTSTQQQGTPDVNYEDICFIKPTGQLYTHGKLYNGENNNNYVDGYLDYLHKLCTENNKNAIILSGGEKYENGITKAFVYIDNVGIKSVSGLHSDSSTINKDYKIILYTILNAYTFIYSTSNLTDNEELVCDWADLARLSDLEVPIATEYRSGLMSAEDKGKLSGVKKITGEWSSISNFNGIGYITVRKPVIPDGKILIRYDCEIKNATVMLAVMNPCDCLIETTSGYSTAYIRYLLYADAVCSFDFRPTAIYL